MKTKTLSILLGVALSIGLAIGAWAFFLSKGSLPDDPLRYAPDETFAIARINAGSLKRAPVVQKLLEESDGLLAGLKEDCSFKLALGLDHATLFVLRDAESERVGGVVALVGSFDRASTVECMQSRLNEVEVSSTLIELEGFETLAVENSLTRAAFIGKKGILLGDEPQLASVLRKLRGEGRTLDEESGVGALFRRIHTGRRDIEVAVSLYEGWHREFGELLDAQQAYHILPEVRDLTDLAFGTSIQTGVNMGGFVRYSSSDRAEAAKESADTLLNSLRRNVLLAITPAAALISALKLDHEGREIRFGLDLGEPELEAVMRVLRAFAEAGRED